MSSKTIGFRPSSDQSTVIAEYMEKHGIKKKSDALKAILNDWLKLKDNSVQSSSVVASDVGVSPSEQASMSSDSFVIRTSSKFDMPLMLQQETAKFLNGQSSPIIERLFALT